MEEITGSIPKENLGKQVSFAMETSLLTAGRWGFSPRPHQSHDRTFNELAIVGDLIGEEDCVVYLLASLPDSFSTLVTALEANKEVP